MAEINQIAVHSGGAGDIISSLPVFKALGGGRYLLRTDQISMHGPNHPYDNRAADAMLPLLRAQPYITSADIWDGKEDYNLDLDLSRSKGISLRSKGIDTSSTNLTLFYYYAFPAAKNFDVNQPWLTVEPLMTDYIIVNRTPRYHSNNRDLKHGQPSSFDYGILKGEKVLFVGLEQEYKNFSEEFFPCEYLLPDNYLHSARLIAGCRYYCGNQSANWWIAEGLKKQPRLLEVCHRLPNSCPTGPMAFDCWSNEFWQKINAYLSQT